MFTSGRAAGLVRAAEHLDRDPLSSHPGLRGPLSASVASLFELDQLDVETFVFLFGADRSWLSAPRWPAGCSVGGALAAYFAIRSGKDGRPSRSEVAEHNRHLIQTVARITSEGSAAGYDSHGIALTLLDLETGEIRLARARTPGDIDERGHYTIQELYRLEPGLASGTSLVLVSGAQTRAATQGDNMYSRANAHPHHDWANRDPLEGCLPEAELAELRARLPTVLGRPGPFAIGHNGDLNSKLKWERFFFQRGFFTDADADSKEFPRIVRLVWEVLRADRHLGGGSRCRDWLLDELFRNRVLDERFQFEGRSLDRAGAGEDLEATLARLTAGGASLVASACAVAAKLVTWCDATSVYVLECLTSIPAREGTPHPPTILVRGPKAGGMVIYEDLQDRNLPYKFASSLANLRARISVYDDERRDEIAVDYISTGARVLTREGSVKFRALRDWELAEILPSSDDTRPELQVFDIRTGERIDLPLRRSPIIDYTLRGSRETAVLKAEGEFGGLPVSERTVAYDSVLGEVLDGPPSLLGRQIRNFPTEEKPRYSVDNQYAAEILMSVVALRRNTEMLFDYAHGAGGQIEGAVFPKPRSLFRQDESLDRTRLRKILRRVHYVVGLGEGTSRNVAGMAGSCANLEGLSDVILDARESNLARTESPRLDEHTLVTFISNSGGTKPVVALAEELLARTGSDLANGPYVWAITNLATSELAQQAARHLGASVTNLPWEKAVGSTYAAFTAFQTYLTMLVYLHQVRGAIRPGRARFLYREIASFPVVAERILSFQAAKDEVARLARHIAGNAIDIAFVGAMQGFDAAEAALKFAEMMQHSRVKFYSGAYEQHGQRATYLRALHANPGTLVILLVPNLETSIGSWMAQLIQENKPRAGRIAVFCAEEDAQALKEAGADYVIPAPRGCTGSLFTDALGKMLLANMLTEATIRRSNEIAGRIRGWGKRLLDASPSREAGAVAGLREELEVIRAQFEHLREGDFSSRERRRILVETEKQMVNEIIDLEAREAKLRHVYLESRQLTAINPAQLDRVEDLIRTLLEMTVTSERDVHAFFNLLDDLILEFSDRSLAMRLAEERFGSDAAKAKMAVHYQGMAKIIGANPIKPDNIAKFQQGWGIPSFLLPPGRRRSDPGGSLADVVKHDGDEVRVVRKNLLRLGFDAAEADLAEGFAQMFRVERAILLEPKFNGGGRVKSFQCDRQLTGLSDRDHPYQLEESLVEEVMSTGRSSLRAVKAGSAVQLQLLAADRFGDVVQGLLMAAVEREELRDRAQLVATVPSLARKLESLQGWLQVLAPQGDDRILGRIPPLDLLAHDEKKLVLQLRELREAEELAARLPFREVFEFLGVDPPSISVADLQTFQNVSNALTQISSAALYRVAVRWEDGNRKYWARRDTERLWGTAVGTVSSYDQGKELRGIKLIAVSGKRLKMGFGRDGARTVIVPVPGETGDTKAIVLLHVVVNEALDLAGRIRTLGEKYRRIVNHASEYVEWDDRYLVQVPMVDLLMLSDEEIADDRIVPLARAAQAIPGTASAS